jgi:small subunit ribosomal protein S1
LDEYIAEHKVGDTVTGRLLEGAGDHTRVELGEGIQGICRGSSKKTSPASPKEAGSAGDLASLSSMLQARWKSGPSPESVKAEPARAGQVRSFRITKLDAASKLIEVELA